VLIRSPFLLGFPSPGCERPCASAAGRFPAPDRLCPQFLSKPAACPVQANPRGVPRTPECQSNLAKIEFLPGDERKEFALAIPQSSEGGCHSRESFLSLLSNWRQTNGAAYAPRKPFATQCTTAVVRKCLSRDPVKPRSRIGTGRHVLQPPPSR
jgi:hypothetical protein